MTTFKTQHSDNELEQPDSLGFDLEVEHPHKGRLKLRLSEKVALILAPGLLVLTMIGGGLWLSHGNKPPVTTPLPPAETVQPQK